MNTPRLAATLAACGLALGMLVIWTGCETDPSSQSVTISPASVVVKPGQQVEFTASGGYEYTWSLVPNDGSGRLNTYAGPTVTYTCLATNIGSSPKQLKVVSAIEGASTLETSNSTPYSVEASADIFYPVPTGSSTSTNST